MPEKTDMQLAGALRVIRNLLKGDNEADKEAEKFLKGVDSGELPKPRRFFLNVAKGPKELPGFAAYVYPTVSEKTTDEGIPVGQTLLNLDATFWACVDNPEIHWEEMVAESIGHEFLHTLQDIFRLTMEEYYIEENISAARDAGESGYMPYKSDWQDTLETAMTTANPGSVVMLIDEDHPEACLHLVKNERPTPEMIQYHQEELGIDLEQAMPEWYPVDGTLGITYGEEIDGQTLMEIHWSYKDNSDDE